MYWNLAAIQVLPIAISCYKSGVRPTNPECLWNGYLTSKEQSDINEGSIMGQMPWWKMNKYKINKRINNGWQFLVFRWLIRQKIIATCGIFESWFKPMDSKRRQFGDKWIRVFWVVNDIKEILHIFLGVLMARYNLIY